MLTGYFIPSPAMLRRLYRAGRRGRVRLVLPAVTDNYATLWAARFTYAGLLARGVDIYEYAPTKLHTKLFLVDEAVQIGSANFDVRSLFLNLEIMLRVEDPAFAAHVRAYIDREVADSKQITAESHRDAMTHWRRMRQMGAYFVTATLDYNITRRLNFRDD